ncbi:MAG: hypothetical protein LUD01_00490 [Clostridiales bacterium]|nr:hypothetical protein [Clostridiales bacterium]
MTEEKIKTADENVNLLETGAAPAGEKSKPRYLHEEFYTMMRELDKIENEETRGIFKYNFSISRILKKVKDKNPMQGQWIGYVEKMIKLENQIPGKDVFSYISDCLQKRKDGEFNGLEGLVNQKELCKEIKINPSTYSMRKANGTPFNREEIDKIVNALKLSSEYSECLYWISKCPMDINDPFYLQLMKNVYEVLGDKKEILKKRLWWLESLMEQQDESADESVEGQGEEDIRRKEQKEKADFWEVEEKIRKEKNIKVADIVPEGLSERTWNRYKNAKIRPGLLDIISCCISLEANMKETSQLLSSSGYTLQDVENAEQKGIRVAKDLKQQIWKLSTHTNSVADDDGKNRRKEG